MYLKQKTKDSISASIGLPYDKIIMMDNEEILNYIATKKEAKVVWSKKDKVDGMPIMTMADVDAKLTPPEDKKFKLVRKLFK
jgi:hypothetical protein